VAAGGTALDPEVVAQLLVRRGGDPLDDLTERERAVLALMAEGRSNAEIATTLVITDSAVSKHINSIFAKLGLYPHDAGHRRVLAVLRYLGVDPGLCRGRLRSGHVRGGCGGGECGLFHLDDGLGAQPRLWQRQAVPPAVGAISRSRKSGSSGAYVTWPLRAQPNRLQSTGRSSRARPIPRTHGAAARRPDTCISATPRRSATVTLLVVSG
jgi:DNA-binding CsgD family transcriptional regulator